MAHCPGERFTIDIGGSLCDIISWSGPSTTADEFEVPATLCSTVKEYRPSPLVSYGEGTFTMLAHTEALGIEALVGNQTPQSYTLTLKDEAGETVATNTGTLLVKSCNLTGVEMGGTCQFEFGYRIVSSSGWGDECS
jgi:hypothetical protein